MDDKDVSPQSKQLAPEIGAKNLTAQSWSARKVSDRKRTEYKALKKRVNPGADSDTNFEEEEETIDTEDIDIETREKHLALAKLGIEYRAKEKEALKLERELIGENLERGKITEEEALVEIADANRRILSSGDLLWRNMRKKARLEDTGGVKLLDPHCGSGAAEAVLHIFRKAEKTGETKATKKKRESHFREDSIKHYNMGVLEDKQLMRVYCHATADSLNAPPKEVIAAHIVPHHFYNKRLAALLFGSRAEELQKPGNCLLLYSIIGDWFDQHSIVIIPVDNKEQTIKRWKMEVVNKGIEEGPLYIEKGKPLFGKDLHGRELTFRNDERPAARFLYFKFVLALVWMRDVKRPGWQVFWAKYYQERPFAIPGPYMRKSMLIAISSHFGPADTKVLESWIADNGFDKPILLSDEAEKLVADEVARQVMEITGRAGIADDSEDSDDSSDGGW
ncbi:hypothetical protein QBC37DRAFT_286002 [Rhypophila decipiens]|uniref:HNH nuclease domain-containing protein n=1 Tax=Rhypophila decipiens TaxID=261697 RepID=A0AAN6YC94_9PEZI|nr:hypothetical protein QBC37DRAFT_286002 [Rhypophila decipiens]